MTTISVETYDLLDEQPRDLRREEGVRQPLRLEDDALFHGGSAFVSGLELAKDLVAAAHRLVERGLGLLLAGERALDFLLDRLAALHEVAETQALGCFTAMSAPGFLS